MDAPVDLRLPSRPTAWVAMSERKKDGCFEIVQFIVLAVIAGALTVEVCRWIGTVNKRLTALESNTPSEEPHEYNR